MAEKTAEGTATVVVQPMTCEPVPGKDDYVYVPFQVTEIQSRVRRAHEGSKRNFADATAGGTVVPIGFCRVNVEVKKSRVAEGDPALISDAVRQLLAMWKDGIEIEVLAGAPPKKIVDESARQGTIP